MRFVSELRAAQRHLRRLLILAAALAHAAAALAGDLYVIASAEVRLGPEEVGQVFLGKRQFAGNVLLHPVDNGELQPQFVSRVLGVDLIRYQSHWTRMSFREGLRPPAVKPGDEDVLSYVRRTPGAIGYVGTLPENANVIARY